MQAFKAICFQLSGDALSGRRRAKKCREVFVLARFLGSFTPRLVKSQRSHKTPGVSSLPPSSLLSFIASRNSAVVFAISLGHLKDHLSQYQNGAAVDEDGKRLHEERVLLLFIGSVSLAAADESCEFVSGISAKRGESAGRSKGQRERGRRGGIYVRSPY